MFDFLTRFSVHRILKKLSRDKKWYADKVKAYCTTSRRIQAFDFINTNELAHVVYEPSGGDVPTYVEYTRRSSTYLIECSGLVVAYFLGIASGIAVSFVANLLITAVRYKS